MSIKALLVDGSDVMCSAIWRLFKNELGIEVIGTATSFAETIALTAALTPDVLLMDPHMPDGAPIHTQVCKISNPFTHQMHCSHIALERR